MISTDALKKYTCIILPELGLGTGIFVGADLILTCRHVVKGKEIGDKVKVVGPGRAEFEAFIKDISADTDLALLITEKFESSEIATLCDCEMVVGTAWASHGHPNTTDGKDVGMTMRGVITENHEDSSNSRHDLSLSVHGISLSTIYGGMSGSGVINELGFVTAIMRYKNISYLNAVSIRKAAEFLKKHAIYVREDELSDFSDYINEAFSSFEDGLRENCLAKGRKIATGLTPQFIVEALKGALFYPWEKGSVKEVITKLRKNSISNKHLWLGWIKFLTYVAVIKGEYENVNKITISIDSAELSKLLNVELSPISVPLTLSLNFFFTENERFFSITSEYIIERWENKDLATNSCHIFNSPHMEFGHRSLTAAEKRKIIPDIGTVEEAGFIVPGKIDFGVMSLKQLTSAVAGSQNIVEASNNLETLFRNALK
jgi:hypothetical protein